MTIVPLFFGTMRVWVPGDKRGSRRTVKRAMVDPGAVPVGFVELFMSQWGMGGFELRIDHCEPRIGHAGSMHLLLSAEHVCGVAGYAAGFCCDDGTFCRLFVSPTSDELAAARAADRLTAEARRR